MRTIATLFLLLGAQLTQSTLFGQGVGINDSGNPPNPTAILDLSSTDKGFLPPRMTTEQRDAIQGSIPSGLIIYNTSTQCMEFFENGSWHSMGCAACIPPETPLAGSHSSDLNSVTWQWQAVSGASGYMIGSTNDLSLATDLGNVTSYLQTGLSCSQSSSMFLWSYGNCTNPVPLQMSFTTGSCPFTCGSNFTDVRDNNVYSTVLIGSQCWMGRNLAYLPSVTGPATGSNSEPYQYVNAYNGSDISAAAATSNYSVYGVLYNWTSAMQGAVSSSTNPSGVQGICPTGWHLPSNSEWLQLANQLGGVSVAGGPLKQAGLTYWNSPNYLASNSSGFTGLPGGARASNGTFSLYTIGTTGLFWTTDQVNETEATGRDLYFGGNSLGTFTYLKNFGFSVRCLAN